MAYDIVIQVTYDFFEQGNTLIRTNVKKEALPEILEAWVADQVGRGRDERESSRKSEYKIEIRLDLSYDEFHTTSDTGNDGLTCGIIMTILSNLENIRVFSLE